VTLKKSALKSMSDYVLPVLQDCDPTQGVEEEYKNGTNTLFCWRMLKQISSVDIANFDLRERWGDLSAANRQLLEDIRQAQEKKGEKPELLAKSNTEAAAEVAKAGDKFKIWTFEGNIDEQAIFLHEKAPKKPMPTGLEEEEEDEEMENGVTQLSDETEVGMFTWGKLKDEAMIDGYESCGWYSNLDADEK